MADFVKFVLAPAGLRDASLAISGSRAGGVGVLNAELADDFRPVLRELAVLATHARGRFGLKVGALETGQADALRPFVARGLGWLIVDLESAVGVRRRRRRAARVPASRCWPRCARPTPTARRSDLVDGLLLKGNEAGGFVGEDSSFILLQKWLGRTGLPLYLRGGLTPHVAAACSAVGVAGGVLDSQLLLMDEVELPAGVAHADRQPLRQRNGRGRRRRARRVLPHPGSPRPRRRARAGRARRRPRLRRAAAAGRAPRRWAGAIRPRACCRSARTSASRRRGASSTSHVAAVLQAIDRAIEGHLRTAVDARPIFEDAPLARSLKLRLPIVQGPMTRVSDIAEFAAAVAEGGALPMVAFALLKGAPLERLLADTKKLLGDRPWGIGLLGFAPQALLDEQLASATAFGPSYAIIAGGRPDQAVRLEAAGVPTFLHVPSANLIPLFLQEGARRFIFEGRECGGHIGPLSSFVLWSTMVDRLTAELAKNTVPADEIELLFAGGIHDAVSSAMVQVLVAPLVARGVKVGILMGSAYLFTRGDRRQRRDRAAVPAGGDRLRAHGQPRVGAGPRQPLRLHAVRAGLLPDARSSIARAACPPTRAGAILDDLILGRLRIASKGRTPARRRTPARVALPRTRSATRACTCSARSRRCARRSPASRRCTARSAEGAAALLAAPARRSRDAGRRPPDAPADIAIVGIASVAAEGEQRPREYWAEHPRQGRRDHRDPVAPLGLAALLRRRPHRQGQDLLEVGRLPRRHGVRSDALRHAAEVDRRRSTRCSS